MKKIIFTITVFFLSAYGVYPYAPYSKSDTNAVEFYTMNEGTDWMFGSNTDVKRSSIGEAVIGITLPSNGESPLYALFQGFCFVRVFIPPSPDYQYDIREIFGYEYEDGIGIETAVWQNDPDPYFTWTLKVEGLEVLGYSVSFDEVPDQFLDVDEPYYQTPDFFLSDGKHTFYVVAKNTEGNFGQYGTFDVWVDTTPPEISDTLPHDIVNNARVKIEAVLSDAASGIDPYGIKMTVTTAVDTFEADISYDEETGVVAYIPDEDWPDGDVTVKLEVDDNAGNSAVPSLWTFTVVTESPLGWVMVNNDAPVTDSPLVNISFFADSASADIVDMIISWDGVFDTEEWESYTEYKANVEMEHVAGEHTVYVKFRDEAGNESDVYTDSIILTMRVPDTFIVAAPNGITEEKSAYFAFRGEGAENIMFRYKLDGGDWSVFGPDTEVTFDNLSDGNHYFQVCAGSDLNGDGNIDESEADSTPATFSWTIGNFVGGEDVKKPIKYYKNR